MAHDSKSDREIKLIKQVLPLITILYLQPQCRNGNCICNLMIISRSLCTTYASLLTNHNEKWKSVILHEQN